jgi:ATP-dependent Clp protease ATP-binding subunit ClpA
MGKIVDHVGRLVQLSGIPAYEFTEQTANAINNAVALACNKGSTDVSPAHIALSLVSDKSGLVLQIIKKIGADPSKVVQEMQMLVSQSVAAVPSAPRMLPAKTELKNVLVQAHREAHLQR